MCVGARLLAKERARERESESVYVLVCQLRGSTFTLECPPYADKFRACVCLSARGLLKVVERKREKIFLLSRVYKCDR